MFFLAVPAGIVQVKDNLSTNTFGLVCTNSQGHLSPSHKCLQNGQRKSEKKHWTLKDVKMVILFLEL